jgi:hypothetical protein
MRLLTPEEQALWEQSTGRPYVPPAQSRTSFSNPFQGKSISDFIPNVLEGKSVTDFIPNVFGRTAPANYQGLLSAGILTPEQVAQTQKTANIQGLLGAGLALAQGMSRTGPRRSGAQNILSALGAGLGASGGAYQQGLQDFSTQQQLQSAVMQQRKALQTQQAIEQVIQSPEIANNPALVAYFRANPEKALERQMNIQMAQQARLGTQSAQPAQLAAQAPQSNVELKTVPPVGEQAEQMLPQVSVIAPPSKFQRNITEAENAADFYSRMGTKESADMANKFRDEANYFRNLQRQDDLVSNVESSLADIDPTLRRRADSLINNSPSLTQEQIQSRLDSILTDDANLKQQLDPRLVEQQLKKARAGATVIDMGSREMEKEFAKGVVEDTRASFAQAKSATNSIKTIERLKPVISAGVYDGVLAGAPRAIDQLSTALGVSGKNTQEKLQRTAVAMQGLASLELTAAEAMRGQGSITENERSLIARAAGGNLRDFTAGEVQALLSSLEKIAQQKIQTHQMNYEVMSEDPVAKKYSKYYKIETPRITPPASSPAPATGNVRTYNPVTGKIE